MPTAHLSVRLVLLIVVVAASTIFLVCLEPPASSACPIVITPKPLRLLYRDSDLVLIARVGDSVAVEKEDQSTRMKTALLVSSLLKGEHKEKVVFVFHYIWDTEDANTPRTYMKDDVLLVFLKRNEKGDGYVGTDYSFGVKKLPEDDLKVYVRRLAELAAIMRGAQPDPAQITEWLVRCAEEAATRWEGAYELAYGASLPSVSAELDTTADTIDATPQASVEITTDGEKEDESTGGERENESQMADTNSEVSTRGALLSERRRDQIQEQEATDFAALLTPMQKERLAATLFTAEELGEGEYPLLRLVSNWHDARLVPFLIKHLTHMADKPPYEAEDLMRLVAHSLDDQSLIKFAADYSRNAAYEDIYFNVEDESSSGAEDGEATDEERAESKREAEERRIAAAEALYQRSGNLRHFLVLAAQPQKP